MSNLLRKIRNAIGPGRGAHAAAPGDARRLRPSLAGYRLEAAIVLLLIATMLSVRYHDTLLRKSFTISPANAGAYGIRAYGDESAGGNSTATADPARPLSWSCTLRNRYEFYFCGYEIQFDPELSGKGIDLSGYEQMRFTLAYDGPAPWIRFYAKNFDPRYSDTRIPDSTKFNIIEFLDRPGIQTVEVKLTDFNVASWWLVNKKIPPELSQPQFDNIVTLDIQPGTGAQPGLHRFRVQAITFEGALLSKAQWYLCLLGFWVAAICLFLAHRFLRLKRDFEERQRLQARKSAELHAAKTAAESASTAKSQFLASMSHELRTPLNAILGYAQLLQREDLTPRQATAARTIHQSGGHLLTLITDILDLAKIEAGKLELSRGSMDLPACTQAIADMIRVRAEDKDLAFAFDAPDDLPQFIVADEKRFRQVLINLLGNAVKFTSEGEVTLSITRLDADEGRTRLRFEVRDTGPGIPAEQQALIFQPFEQAGHDSDRDAGTGLGLSISSQIIALMGSRIEVESSPGKGSCFRFELAFELAEQATTMPVSGKGSITGYKGPRRKLLIVDDREENRGVLTAMTEQLGFETIEAADGGAAVEAAGRERPDLILMDMRMPEVDGFEAIARLRAEAATAAIPVVSVSASATDEFEARCTAAGARAFLGKPVDHEELVQLLAWCLELDWTWEEPKDAGQPASEAAIVAPPPEQMAILHELALAGNMRAIRRQADEIVAIDERYRPFAETLHQLAQTFQSPAILRLIEQHGQSRQAA